MAINSFSSLQSSMGRFLKRGDLAAMLPDFIMLAEQHFDRVIKTRARRETFSITPSSTQISLPSDWGRVIEAYYNGKPIEFYPRGFPSGYAGGRSDHFHGYQIIGDTLALSVHQLGLPLKIDYYTAIEPLSDSNTSNWLLEDAPDIYLAGSLHEAFGYIRDTDQAAYWLSKRDDAIQEFIDDDNLSKTPDQPLTMRAG